MGQLRVRIGAWDRMIAGVMHKVQLAELMPAALDYARRIAATAPLPSRALKRFVRILTAEKLFCFRKSDGVGHNEIALHFFTLAKQTVNQLAISAFAQTAQQNQKDQGARP
jgi:hypothetical protein